MHRLLNVPPAFFPPPAGDAFHVAFTDIQSAVQFCLDVQYQVRWSHCGAPLPAEPASLLTSHVAALSHIHVTPCSRICLHARAFRKGVALVCPTLSQMMDQEWPAEVLRLAQCKEVKGPDGSVIWRGPRIRMGVHWAVEGTVAQRRVAGGGV